MLLTFLSITPSIGMCLFPKIQITIFFFKPVLVLERQGAKSKRHFDILRDTTKQFLRQELQHSTGFSFQRRFKNPPKCHGEY